MAINQFDNIDPKERFMQHVIKMDSGCWIWTGHIFRTGYGEFWLEGSVWSAHRASHKLFKGEIPEGLEVLHNCPLGDNKACVNPDHLWLGTQDDNIQDMIAKGRKVVPFGNDHCHAKITEADVPIIRELYHKYKFKQREIAAFYGLCQTTVSELLRGLNWKHVK